MLIHYMDLKNHLLRWPEVQVAFPLRCKLFQSVLTPTVLNGCGAWVLTVAMEAQLELAQMIMLRTRLAMWRHVAENRLETSVDWAKRTGRVARQAMKAHGVAD